MPVPSENEQTPSPRQERRNVAFELNIPASDVDRDAESGAEGEESPTAEHGEPAEAPPPREQPAAGAKTANSRDEDYAVEVQSPTARARAADAAASDFPQAKPGFLARVFGGRTRRDTQIQALQTGYFEMVEMMRSIRNHLDHQVDTQRQLADSLRDLPDAVSGLRDVGRMTAQQTEVLGLVREQLERNADHEKALVNSMEGFNSTLNIMDQTSRSTTQTVASLVERSHASEASLRAMLERSEKRMATLTGFMSFLALGAVAFALYVVMVRTSGDGGSAADSAAVADNQIPIPALAPATTDPASMETAAPPEASPDAMASASSASPEVAAAAAEAPESESAAEVAGGETEDRLLEFEWLGRSQWNTDARLEEDKAAAESDPAAVPASPGAEAAALLEDLVADPAVEPAAEAVTVVEEAVADPEAETETEEEAMPVEPDAVAAPGSPSPAGETSSPAENATDSTGDDLGAAEQQPRAGLIGVARRVFAPRPSGAENPLRTADTP